MEEEHGALLSVEVQRRRRGVLSCDWAQEHEQEYEGLVRPVLLRCSLQREVMGRVRVGRSEVKG